jgi:uncharacterized protein YndB with AHSA1/START domain
MLEPSRTPVIRWRLHLRSAPEVAYAAIATAEGRARFWAESADEEGGQIAFRFPNGLVWTGRILEAEPPRRFGVVYFGGSACRFALEPDGRGGTDLTLTDEGVAPGDWSEVHAGWISVLMALKAAVDFGVDLRNHDAGRTWDRGYVDN